MAAAGVTGAGLAEVPSGGVAGLREARLEKAIARDVLECIIHM